MFSLSSFQTGGVVSTELKWSTSILQFNSLTSGNAVRSSNRGFYDLPKVPIFIIFIKKNKKQKKKHFAHLEPLYTVVGLGGIYETLVSHIL